MLVKTRVGEVLTPYLIPNVEICSLLRTLNLQRIPRLRVEGARVEGRNHERLGPWTLQRISPERNDICLVSSSHSNKEDYTHG